MSTKNKIIVLEGLPGTGKTTLGNLFNQEMLVIPEMILDEAASKEAGELFYFKNDLAKIKKAKDTGDTVLVERSYASTLAHNYAKLKIDGNDDYFKVLEAFAKNKKEGQLVPDLYIYLKIGVKKSLIRKNRAETSADIWTQEKYLSAIESYYNNYFQLMEPDVPVVVIDGEMELDDIYVEIKKYLAN